MIAQKEQDFLAARVEFDQLLEYVQGASQRGEKMYQVECNLWEGMLKLGLEMLRGYVAAQGLGDMGERLTLADGQKVQRLPELHAAVPVRGHPLFDGECQSGD